MSLCNVLGRQISPCKAPSKSTWISFWASWEALWDDRERGEGKRLLNFELLPSLYFLIVSQRVTIALTVSSPLQPWDVVTMVFKCCSSTDRPQRNNLRIVCISTTKTLCSCTAKRLECWPLTRTSSPLRTLRWQQRTRHHITWPY